jgi:hypothetical protein
METHTNTGDIEMTNKQLAEKVATLRGYEYRDCYFGDANRKGWCHESSDEAFCWDGDLEECVFDWPITGLMIEEMQREGWELEVKGGWVLFYKPYLFHRKRTTGVSRQDGYHIAIAKAFIEAKEIINES